MELCKLLYFNTFEFSFLCFFDIRLRRVPCPVAEKFVENAPRLKTRFRIKHVGRDIALSLPNKADGALYPVAVYKCEKVGLKAAVDKLRQVGGVHTDSLRHVRKRQFRVEVGLLLRKIAR